MKKYRKTALTAVSALFAAFGATALACGTDDGNKSKPTAGPEAGIYYFESAGEEYTINLMAGGNALMQVRGESKPGTYKVTDGAVSLTFGKDDVLVGTLSGNELSLDFEGSPVTFYKKVYYTVEFDANEGTAVGSVEVLNGKPLGKPAEPTRENYAFVGWYTDANFTSPFIFGAQGITQDTKLYAQWVKLDSTAQEYTVSLDLGDGAESQEKLQTRGGRLFDLKTPEKSGYIFQGWYVSAFEDKDRLTAKWDSSYVFTESTTLFAVWKSDGDASKAPNVSVSAGGIKWEADPTVTRYNVAITGPEDFTPIYTTVTGTSLDNTEQDPLFTVSGDYEIRVTPNIAGGDQDRNTAVRYYRHNALDRVSIFSIAAPSALIFNPVEHAEHYYIDINCGNPDHKHNPYDNGNSTYYNFANCVMKEGGIEFTVTATASDWASSTSRVFVYERRLDEVGGLKYDETTQTVAWNPVENAASYEVTVKDKTGAHDAVTVTANSFSLKNFASGTLSVSVKPVTSGYNSPAAKSLDIEKLALAAPADVRIVGSKLMWTADENAESYIVNIDSHSYPVEKGTTEFDIASVMAEISNASGKYNITVTAIAANSANNSLPSDKIEARFDTLAGSVKYYGGIVSWRSVIGAVEYRVRVNDGAELVVANGENSAAIKLGRKGINTVSVRFSDGTTESDWETIEVTAYSVEFDSRGGTSIDTQYLAPGDKIDVSKVPVWVGREFNGWYDAIGGSAGNASKLEEGDTLVGMSDRKYYADWQNARYTLALDAGAGALPDDSTGEETVQIQNTYKLPVPEPTDKAKVFVGWYSAAVGGEKYTDENGNSTGVWMLASDATVHAHYETAFQFTYLNRGETGNGYAVKANKLSNLGLKSVKVPDMYDDGVNGEAPVLVVDAYAFSGCSSLISIDIPDCVETIEVDSSAFNNCTSLVNVNIYHVDGVIDPAYSSFGGALIYNNEATGERELKFVPVGKTSVYRVPDTVTDIAPKAFNRTKVKSVIIPSSVRNVREKAFTYCDNLTDIVFNPANGAKADSLIIASGAFDRCAKLNSITYPARLSSFDATMFSYCTAMSKVSMEVSDSAKYIAQNDLLISKDTRTLVYFPSAKTTCDIPAGVVTSIGAYSFYKASNLAEITIPYWITSIDNNAFAECSALVKVTVKGGTGSKLEIGEQAFASCVSLSEIKIESNANVTSIGKNAFYHCVSLKNFAVPGGVDELSDYAFADCTNLASVTFGDLETIGNYVFSNCKNLTSVTFPKTLKTVGNNAFELCTSLRNVTIDENGAELSFGDNAFKGCTGLTTLHITANVIELGDGIFTGCKNLARVTVDERSTTYDSYDDVVYRLGGESGTDYVGIVYFPYTKSGEVNLPDTMTTINGGVFQNNTNITKVTIGANVTQIGDLAFGGCTSLRTVEFAQNRTKELNIGDAAFYNCSALSSINLPEKLNKISDSMFNGCVSLTSITIPSTVQSIGSYAFTNGISYGLTMLSNVTFAKRTENGKQVSDLTTIGYRSFMNATALTELTIPYSVTKISQGAFRNNTALTSLVIEDGDAELSLAVGVSMGGGDYGDSEYYGVFSGLTSLTTLSLPDRLQNIPDYAFYGCSKLSTVNIPANVANRDKTNAKETSVSINSTTGVMTKNTNLTVNYGGTGIGASAFYNCSALETVTYTANSDCERALSLDRQSFGNCHKLTTVNMPARFGKTSDTADPNAFGSYAYSNTFDTSDGSSSFTTFAVETGGEEVKSIDGILYTADGKTLLYCPPAKRGSVTISATVEIIGESAFINSNVSEILFEEDIDGYGGNVEQLKPLVIKNNSFQMKLTYAERPLRTITFPKRLSEIGTNAFDGCKNLGNIEFKPGCDLTKIGKEAFKETKITTIKLPEKLTEMGDNVFSKVEGLNSLTIPTACAKYISTLGCPVPTTVNSYSDGGEEISYPKYVTIVDGVLKEYSMANDAVEYTVPTNVKEISAKAFAGNKHLKRLIFPSSDVKITIGESAFANSALESVTFQSGSQVTTLGQRAFEGCTQLASVSFPDNYDKLSAFPSYLFSGCSLLGSIRIPNKVTSLGDYVFQNCSSLETVQFEQQTITSESGETSSVYNIKSIGRGSFNYCTMLGSITLPGSITTLGTGSQNGDMFTGCSELKTVTLLPGKEDLTFVAGSSNFPFKNCAKLETVDLGNRLSKLPNYLFADTSSFTGSSKLTTIQGIDNITEIGAYVFQYRKPLGAFTIPSKVTKLGNYAFKGCTGLTSVNIPESVKTVGTYLFDGCTGLQQVTGMNGLTAIGNYMFRNSGLASITIPANVTSIGTYAFNGCASLNTVTFENVKDSKPLTVTNGTSGSAPFGNCSKLETVDFGGRSVTVGNYAFYGNKSLQKLLNVQNITSIGNYAFYNCSALIGKSTAADDDYELNLSAVTTLGTNVFYGCSSLNTIVIPNKLTTIPSGAFNGTGLVSLNIPANITSIANTAFANCKANGIASLTSVVFEASDKALTITDASSASNSPFYGATNLTSVNFNGRPVQLGNSAFNGCGALVNVLGYNNLTKIGVSAFQGCAFTSFDIPQSVTTLGNSAFRANTHLMSVSIPTDNFATLWAGTFYGCSALESVKFTGNGTMLSEIGGSSSLGCFQGCTSLTSFEFPNYIDTLGDYAFANCGFATLTVPASVTNFGSHVFANNKSLVTLSLPTDSAESFGDGAFTGCAQLQKVEFTGNNLALSEISDLMFWECASLSDITLPTSISYIGTQAFMGTAVSFGLHEGITYIGESAFDGCNNLTEVVIPSTVSELVGNPFSNCSNLTNLSVSPDNEIYTIVNKVIYSGGGSQLVGCLATATGDLSVANTVTTIEAGAFMRANVTNVVIEGNITAIDEYTFYGCSKLESVELPGSVISIGDFAFRNCTSLKSIKIPEGVVTLGNNVFAGCTSLMSVTLPSTLISMGKNVFDGCAVLNNVVIPAELAKLPDYTFANCTGLTTLSFARGSKLGYVGTHVFENSGLTSITLPAGILFVDHNEFYGAAALETISFESADFPVQIGTGSASDDLFEGCDSLATIDFNGRNAYIMKFAFKGVESLTTVSWEDVVSIGQNAFENCTNLTDVTITPKMGVATDHAFMGAGVVNLTIENGVSLIDLDAFNNTKIVNLRVPGSVKKILNGAFANCSELQTVTVDSGVTEIGANTAGYRGVFYNCAKLHTVELPDTVSLIGVEAFAECKSLTSVNVPASVSTIGSSAFSGSGLETIDLTKCTRLTLVNTSLFKDCDKLTSVTLPESITSIGNGTFEGCSALKSIVLPASVNRMNGGEPVSFVGWDNTQTIYVLGYTSADDAKEKGASFPEGWSGNANVVWGHGPEN